MIRWIVLSLGLMSCGGGCPSFTVEGFDIYDHESQGLDKALLTEALVLAHNEALKRGVPEATWVEMVSELELHAEGGTPDCGESSHKGPRVGCFKHPNEIHWFQNEPCHIVYLGHELAHAVQLYWLGDSDHNHRNESFFGWPKGYHASISIPISRKCAL